MDSKIPFVLVSTLVLGACNGPWNIDPSDEVGRDPDLIVSSMVVGGMPFDTLWLERTTPIQGKYDSTRVFVEEATIRMRNTSDPTDSVVYRPVSGSGVAWVPAQTRLAKAGATYELDAQVRWNASRDWPSGRDIRTTSLHATTTLPSDWSVREKSPEAPIEALIPSLAGGAEPTSDSATLREWDRERPGAVARWKLGLGTIDSVRAGIPVTRPVVWGDTVWYIHSDARLVRNSAGQGVTLTNRQYVYTTRRGAGFGGMFSVQYFDPTSARIEPALVRALRKAVGDDYRSTEDSASDYQAGGSRYFEAYAAYSNSVVGWPDHIYTSNIAIGYTGRYLTRYFAVDARYVAYSQAKTAIAGGDKTVARYSNIQGGQGYFTGALVDSFQLFVRTSSPDTIPLEALRGAACRRAWDRHINDGRGFEEKFCIGTDYTAGMVGGDD